VIWVISEYEPVLGLRKWISQYFKAGRRGGERANGNSDSMPRAREMSFLSDEAGRRIFINDLVERPSYKIVVEPPSTPPQRPQLRAFGGGAATTLA